MTLAVAIAPVRRFATSVWGIALIAGIGWQALMTLFGQLVDLSFGNSGHQTLGHTLHWDGGWYLWILNGGYDASAAAPVFYPLFPLAVHTVQALFVGLISVATAGLIVNTISTWLSLVALVKIAEFYVSNKHRWLPTILFITSPAAIFLHLFYVEALFCAVVFWAFLFALRRQWHWMAVMLAVSTAAKLPALLFVGLCGLEFLRAYDWNIKRILNRNLLWFLLAPLGFVAYGLYLHVLRGDFLAMFHGYKATNDWAYHEFNPNFIDTLHTVMTDTVHLLAGGVTFEPIRFVNHLLPLVCLAIVFGLSLFALFLTNKKAIPLGIFGLVTIVFLSLNSNVVSVHRYLLPCLVIYVAAIIAIERFKPAILLVHAAIYTGVLLQAYLLILFVGNHFAG